MAYSPEELKIVEKIIEEVKKLVKKYGYEYTRTGCNKYFKTTAEKQKLLKEIKEREEDLEKLKDKL